jgi:hypothetical protein
MDERLLLRELYGKACVTILRDGQRVPWKLLSVGEWLEYEDLLASGRYPAAYLENEIFRKCVLNPVLTKQIDKLHAGTVSTVVFNIMECSAPGTIQELEYKLNEARMRADKVLHDLIGMVCQAFPGYKPEDVYAMDQDTLMMRVAIAERKLLKAGILKEPISLTPREEVPQRKGSRLNQQTPPVAPPVNLAKEHRAQKAPVGAQTVITKKDVQEAETAYTGHEREDKIVLEHQMLQETVGIYDDYMKQVQAGKKVRVKTDEERKAEALARSERNRRENLLAARKQQAASQAEAERLAKVRKIKRTVKKR